MGPLQRVVRRRRPNIAKTHLPVASAPEAVSWLFLVDAAFPFWSSGLQEFRPSVHSQWARNGALLILGATPAAGKTL